MRRDHGVRGHRAHAVEGAKVTRRVRRDVGHDWGRNG
jgi:hypothetical protein